MADGDATPEGGQEVELDEIEVSPLPVQPNDKPATTDNKSDNIFDEGKENSGNSGGETTNSSNNSSYSAEDVNRDPKAYIILALDEARALLKDVAPDWRFVAVMPPVKKQLTSALSISQSGGVSYNSARKLSTPNIPIARCESVDLSPVTIDTDQRFGGGMSINVARSISTSNITLNFYEDDQYSVTKYLWAWHKSIVSDDKLFSLPIDYKKKIIIMAFSNRSNGAPALMIDLIDCFPTISAGGLNYSLSNNGFITVSCDFAVDNQEYGFNG